MSGPVAGPVLRKRQALPSKWRLPNGEAAGQEYWIEADGRKILSRGMKSGKTRRGL